jgi:hemolysin III
MSLPTTQTAEPAAAHPPKPLLRGVLHLAAFPVSLAAGAVLLLAVADGPGERWACAVYTAAAATLFGVSALYHRGRWDARTHARLRRLDHSNIFLMIAGTYTPLCIALLSGTPQRVVLGVVWLGALVGIVFRVAWLHAPAWLYTPFYVALGWVAITVMPELAAEGGGAVVALLVVGGLAYSAGATVYALKRPDPVPDVFGFHEVFHVGTILGYVCHYAAIVVAVR